MRRTWLSLAKVGNFRKAGKVLFALAALLLLASVTLRQVQDAALAQSGGSYDLSWWTVDGGAYTFSTGGDYSLGGTAGQPDAGPALTGGDYALMGSFWWGGVPSTCR